jgi:hypothetical protein
LTDSGLLTLSASCRLTGSKFQLAANWSDIAQFGSIYL